MKGDAPVWEESRPNWPHGCQEGEGEAEGEGDEEREGDRETELVLVVVPVVVAVRDAESVLLGNGVREAEAVAEVEAVRLGEMDDDSAFATAMGYRRSSMRSIRARWAQA